MNSFKSSFFALHAFIGIFLLLISPSYAESLAILNRRDSIPGNQISEKRFIRINGIDQWVTIKGNRSKPVILFLHGGPGSPLSPYADAIYSGWEKDFILVQWDQRGSGKTFGRTAPVELTPDYLKSNPLTLEQMTTDGIGLAEYLTKHLGKQKIVLFGSSWGSELAVPMAVKRPDLFYAYVGHSQVVNPAEDLKHAYHKVYQMVQTSADQKSLKILDSIGKPPYDRAKKAGQLLRIVKKYERENSTAAPDSWFTISPEYDNEKDAQHRYDGDDYSFVNYMGDKRFGIKSMSSSINLMKDGLDFKIPVYLIQGEEDILTPKEITKDYFGKIGAPQKEYFMLPGAAHGFNLSVIETQYKIIRSLKID